MSLVVLTGGSVPNYSAERFCRGIAELLHDPDYRQPCIAREREAFDSLKGSWSKFDARDRSRCVSLSSLGATPSYLELLACLETAQEIREREAREHLLQRGRRP
ncbi:hypothetical protein BN961_03916 [Afipia felis]|uniref:Uncharacterized protein n=2 Tax=Afipia TaxID=1033 RepID=K8NZQ7_9BRAD|nr:hypothetical protein HMPREF9695_04920 [Afipia broomeae ATCC 49717]CEG10476.1 hypothetical protein BN961_03916 [Afipia felis]